MIEQEVSEKSNSASAGLMERYLNHLNRLKDNHSIWKNPLLLACEKDNLKLEDFQYFFSQYYFYSNIPVEAGDMVYVPRWARHQTKNTGDSELKFFAVTDYGFTKNIPENSESIYRLKK